MFCDGKKTKIRFLHLQVNKVADGYRKAATAADIVGSNPTLVTKIKI